MRCKIGEDYEEASITYAQYEKECEPLLDRIRKPVQMKPFRRPY